MVRVDYGPHLQPVDHSMFDFDFAVFEEDNPADANRKRKNKAVEDGSLSGMWSLTRSLDAICEGRDMQDPMEQLSKSLGQLELRGMGTKVFDRVDDTELERKKTRKMETE